MAPSTSSSRKTRLHEPNYRRSFLAGLTPDPLMTVSEWADAYRVLSQKASAEAGQWRTQRTPYLREIMDCLSANNPIQTVTFVKGAQVGGTEAGSNWIGYVMDHAPGPMLAVQPTVEMAKRNSKQRIQPLIEESPRLREKVKPSRERDSGNTILAKEFHGGILIMTGANSAVGLRSMSARYIFFDEIDAYPGDVDGEGDPVSLAEARARTFARRKILKVSTPTKDGTSRIQASYDKSDQRKYEVPCPHCGHYQDLVFSRLRWPEGVPQQAVYHCIACEEAIPEHFKTQMLDEGQWVARNANANNKKHAGFHLNSLYSPLGWFSWADAAEMWEAAKKNKDKLRGFINTVLGETWRETGESPDWERLFDRREQYQINTVPASGLILTAGVDVQRDRLEVEVVAWGKDKQSFSIDYRVIPGDTSEDDCWLNLFAMLNESFPHASGAGLTIKMMAIDSGFNTQEVYNRIRTQPVNRVIAVKGSDTQQATVGVPKAVDVDWRGKKIRRGVKVWAVGSSVIKTELYGWLRLSAPTEEGQPYPHGYCHFPQYSDQFFKMLTAEQLMIRTLRGGGRKYEWEKIRERNEALDCFDQDTEALTSTGWKKWSDVVATDLLATVDKKTQLLQYQKPKQLISHKYSGPMIRIESGRLDLLVTPNHRMWVGKVLPVNGKKQWVEPTEFVKASDLKPHMALKTICNWDGDYGPVTIPESISIQNRIISKEVIINRDLLATFMGWFISEGSLTNPRSKTQNNLRYRVHIAQIKTENRNKIRDLLSKLPWNFSENESGFEIRSKQLFNFLKPCWNRCYDLCLPDWLMSSSQNVIKSFLDSAILGDGSTDNFGHRTYYTVCKKLADQMQECFIKIGRTAVVRERKIESLSVGTIRDKLVKPTCSQWHVSEIRTKRAYLYGTKRVSCISTTHYDGQVYCAEMPNDTLIVRRNGKVTITGNCRVYARAAAAIVGIDRFTKEYWDELEWNLTSKPIETQKQPVQASRTEIVRRKRKDSFWS